LPSPLAHAAGVAVVSVVATTIGAAIAVGRTPANVVLSMLVAIAAYVGAVATAVTFAPRLVSAPEQTAPLLARWASAAVLPIAVSGLFNVVPIALLGLAWSLFGAVICAWSAYVGASAMLGLEGPARRGAAGTLAALGLGPVLAGSLLRIVLGR